MSTGQQKKAQAQTPIREEDEPKVMAENEEDPEIPTRDKPKEKETESQKTSSAVQQPVGEQSKE